MPVALQPIQNKARTSIAATNAQESRPLPRVLAAKPSNPASDTSQSHLGTGSFRRRAGGKKRPDGGVSRAGASVVTVTVAVTAPVPFGVTVVGETLQEP